MLIGNTTSDTLTRTRGVSLAVLDCHAENMCIFTAEFQQHAQKQPRARRGLDLLFYTLCIEFDQPDTKRSRISSVQETALT